MYLIDNKLIFIHFPKTSGTRIKKDTNSSLIPPAIRHIGINHLLSKYYMYPIFGMIRNPFSFYVSFYNYFRNNKMLNLQTREILFCKYFIQDKNINLDNIDEVKNDFSKHLKLLLTKGHEHKIQIQNYNCGLITRLYQLMYIKNNIDITPDITTDITHDIRPDITIIKMEEYDKINSLLSKYNINFNKSSKKINSSKEVDYRLYYTSETIKLVENYDNEILEKYNYHF